MNTWWQCRTGSAQALLPRALLAVAVLTALWGPHVMSRVATGQTTRSAAETEYEALVDRCLRDARSPAVEDRRKALHGLWEIAHYRKAPARADEVFGAVIAAAKAETDGDARRFAFEALARLRRPEAMGLLIEALKDEDPAVAMYAAQGMRELGPAARDAVPALTAALARRNVAGDAAEALSHILAADANPILIRAWREDIILDVERDSVLSALSAHPDAAAADIMAKALAEDRYTATFAALYFERLDQPVSVERLRWALANVRGKQAASRNAADVRTIAARYLGRKREPVDFDLLLRAVSQDGSPEVRTAAAEGLGGYRDDRAVPDLAARLREPDEGFEAHGHTDGQLHEAVVAALARIGSPAALGAIYERTDDTRFETVAKACTRFWRRASLSEFELFLDLYERRPLADSVAAGLLGDLFYEHRSRYQLPDDAEETRRLEAEFFAANGNHDVVPTTRPARDPNYVVEPSLRLYRGGFAIYHASVRHIEYRGNAHGYGAVYVKREGRWRLLGKFYGWVT